MSILGDPKAQLFQSQKTFLILKVKLINST